MKVRTILSIIAATSAVWLSGCATPEARIKADPEAFAKLPVEQQELVKKGQVAIGFNMDAVRLALGDPTRTTIRQDALGKSEVWHYTEYETADGVYLYTGYYHRWGPVWGPRYGFGYPAGPWPYPFYDDYPGRIPRDYLKVTFNQQGLVSEVEQEKRSS